MAGNNGNTSISFESSDDEDVVLKEDFIADMNITKLTADELGNRNDHDEHLHNHKLANDKNVQDSYTSQSTSQDNTTLLPDCHSTPLRDETAAETTKTIPTKTKKPRKWTKQNYTPDGKHIDTKTLRRGKSKSDTFYKRSRILIQKCNELNKLTDGQLEIKILPLTDRGDAQHYKTDKFDNYNPKVTLNRNMNGGACNINENDSDDEEEQETVTYGDEIAFKVHSTPQKRMASSGSSKIPAENSPKAKKKVDEKNVCRICRAKWNSPQDLQRNSLWVKCSENGCSYWTHAKCCNIFYKNTARGRRELDAWAIDRFFCPSHMPNDEDSNDETQDERIVIGKGKRLARMVEKVKKDRKGRK